MQQNNPTTRSEAGPLPSYPTAKGGAADKLAAFAKFAVRSRVVALAETAS
jgi:hypothetical protein